MNTTLIIILITLVCILVLAFLIRPVKNYIYKPQRYVEYIHPTSYREGKYIDTVIINNKNEQHHGLIDLSQLDSRYSKETISLPNQGMIYIWFDNREKSPSLNHFYVDYLNNPTYWKFNNIQKGKYKINLNEYEGIHFSNVIPKIDSKMKFDKCSEGFHNSEYYITQIKNYKDKLEYCFVFYNKNLNLLSYYYKQL